MMKKGNKMWGYWQKMLMQASLRVGYASKAKTKERAPKSLNWKAKLEFTDKILMSDETEIVTTIKKSTKFELVSKHCVS